MLRTVRFYVTVDGRCPVTEFIDTFSDKAVTKFFWTLKLIQELERIPQTYFKKLTGTDFYECRIEIDRCQYRLLGFFYKGDVIILTNGFQKKTWKIPRKELKICEQRRRDYLLREGVEK